MHLRVTGQAETVRKLPLGREHAAFGGREVRHGATDHLNQAVSAKALAAAHHVELKAGQPRAASTVVPVAHWTRRPTGSKSTRASAAA